MFHLYLKIIKDYWKSTTWFSIGMGLIGIYVISVYPSFEKSSDEFNKVIGNLPEAIKIVIGEGSMSSIEGFIISTNIENFCNITKIICIIHGCFFSLFWFMDRNNNRWNNNKLSLISDKYYCCIIFFIYIWH